MQNKNKKILIIQTAFLGDVILALPMIQTLKNILPDAVIDFLCIPLTANVLENNTLINNIIKFDKKGKDKLNKLFEVISIVRKNNYHIILTPHRSMRSALITYFSKAPVKIGFDRNSLAFLLTKKVAYDINSHEIQRNLDLLSVIPGIDLDDSKISSKAILNPSEKDMKIVDSLIAQKENIIVFAPCSKWFTKQITISKSIEITKAFIEKSYVVVLIGSGDDFNFCREMERNTNSNIYSSGMGKLVNLCGRLSPLQSYYAINKAKVLITVDSASQHLGGASETPIVLIYGSTNSKFGFYPLTSKHTIIENNDIFCRPCTDHGRTSCPQGHFKCINDLKVHDIVSAAENLITN